MIIASTVIAVAVGLTASAASADPSVGSLVGQLTDDGTPIPFANVTLYTVDRDIVAFAQTNDQGSYDIESVVPGDYKLSFTLPGFVEQFVHQTFNFDSADIIAVAAGAPTVVNESAAPHGSIAGTVTASDGSPLPNPFVQLFALDGALFAQTNGAQDGTYRLPFVPPGNYKIEFQAGFDGPAEFAHQARRFEDGIVFAVTVGQETTVDEQFLPTGTIAGHLTNAGQPVSGAFISATSLDGAETHLATSADDGSFLLTTFPGSFIVSFQLPNGLTQYAHQKVDPSQADPIVVTAGEQTTLDESVIPTGTISGHLTAPDGSPVSGASVSVNSTFVFLNATTDDAGFYQVDTFPGTYLVSFSTSVQTQVARNRVDPQDADLIAVTSGATTTVDEQLLAPGTLTVRLRDGKTHAPVDGCVFAAQQTACTTAGVARFDPAGPGHHRLFIFANDESTYLASTDQIVDVHSGDSTSLTVDLVRGATVSALVRDSRTRAPVAQACLELVDPLHQGGLGTGGETCTDATGRVTLTRVAPGTYNAFVWARDGVHGHQWVGSDGGVGASADAERITVKAGDRIALDPVRLDLAGTIAGTVSDRATGTPLEFATVGFASYSAGFGGNGANVGTDAAGHYTLGGLGPYRWSIFARKNDHAAVWSGNTPNRNQATGIQVRSGQTTTYDVALARGVSLTGTVTGRHGEPVDSARAIVFNATTGDEMNEGDVDANGQYQVQLFGPQQVRVEYVALVRYASYAGWVGGTDFEHATIVSVPSTGSALLNIVASTPSYG
jgi:carboxypeptidase family protein